MARSRPDGEYNLASYAYDAQSRLISRSVGVSPTTTTAYIHDGWNRIAEYTVTPGNPNATPPTEPVASLSKSYLWGLDLSATLQGAGGVGGLLSVNTIGGSVHYPAYDGNGNITEYLDVTGGVLAHFEYDPFGNTVVSTDATNQFEYRFSTKPIDSATGLFYYGYRFYDPLTGRWPSRDPIGEIGGVNLYGFVWSDGINWVDHLGLNVYGIDGTNANVDIHPEDGMTNVKDIVNRANEAGESAKYYGGPASDNSSTVHVGDMTGLIGPSIYDVIDRVVSDICADYCKDRSIKINLFGWSRGAIAAVEVAKRLNEKGCACVHPGGVVRERRCYLDGNGNEAWGTFETIVAAWTEIIKPVPVNFMGLYDAVEMVPNPTSPDLATELPGNVGTLVHTTKWPQRSISIKGKTIIFPTQKIGGPGQVFPCKSEGGGNSTHGQIGVSQTETAAHMIMIERARSAGVNLGGEVPKPFSE